MKHAIDTERIQVSREEFVHNPDLDMVSGLMLRVWRRPCLEFTPDLIGCYIFRPTGDPNLSLALFCDQQLAGYVAYVPCRINYKGKELNIVYGSFWTAHQAFHRRVPGFKVHRELQRLSQEKGYDGFLTISTSGSRESKALWTTFRLLRQRLVALKSFRYMMAPPARVRHTLRDTQELSLSPYADHLSSACARLINSITSSVDLARLISDEDVSYVLRDRPHTRTWLLYDGGAVRALFNVIHAYVLDKRRRSTAFCEHIAFGDLTESEMKTFLASIFRDPFWDGIDAICVPATGYFDESALARMGFCPSQLVFTLYYAPYDTPHDSLEIRSFYMDFF